MTKQAKTDGNRPLPGSASGDRTRIYGLMAPGLVLLTPAVSFLGHSQYDLLTPEAGLFLVIFAVVGLAAGLILVVGGRLTRAVVSAILIVLFVDIQFDWLKGADWSSAAVLALLIALAWLFHRHLLPVMTAMFGVMLLSTLALDLASGAVEAKPAASPVRAAQSGDLPVVVHIVLDEHIGIEGIPGDVERAEELRDQLKRFYVGNGFRLYGKAYSQYTKTTYSLLHMFNLVPELDTDLIRTGLRGEGGYQMVANEYLSTMGARGYRQHVDQFSYLRFCAPGDPAVVTCRTHDVASLKPLENAPVTTFEKTQVFLSVYARLSSLYVALRKRYKRTWRFAVRLGIDLPGWTWERPTVEPMQSLGMLRQLGSAVASARPGDMFLTHVIVPHYPYVYRPDCEVRPFEEWSKRFDVLVRFPTSNSAESRRIRYDRYLGQVQCVTRALDEILAVLRGKGLLDRSIVIIHGDHGSRITHRDPVASSKEKTEESDYVDSFSTLFAIRAPGLAPGYDTSLVSIQELFAGFVGTAFAAAPSLPASTERAPSVYVMDIKRRTLEGHPPMKRVPMPDFGVGPGRDTAGSNGP